MTVEQLKAGISQLPVKELSRLAAWFEEYYADEWDRQIEADIQAGRLDEAGRKVDRDFEARS